MRLNKYPNSDTKMMSMDCKQLTVVGRLGILASLFRVGNSILLGLLAVFSVMVTRTTDTWRPTEYLLLFTSWTTLAAFAYALNDLVDRVTDRVNRPTRYLQRVDGTPSWIIISVCAVALVAVLTGAIVQIEQFLILEFVWSCCAIGYSFGLKRRSGMLANILSAVCVTGSATPGLLQGYSPLLAGFLPVLFFLMLAREIWKDIEDEPGDRIAGLRTIPILRGRTFAGRSACIASGAAFSALILNRPLPPSLEIVALILGGTGLIASSLLFAFPLVLSAREIQRKVRYTAILVFTIFVVGSFLI